MILSENACFLRHDLFQKWKFLHLKTKYALLTFSGSDAGLYPRAAVAMETIDQGIKLKLMEMFFLKYGHNLVYCQKKGTLKINFHNFED